MSEHVAPRDPRLILSHFMFVMDEQRHQVKDYEEYDILVHQAGVPQAVGSLIRQHPDTSHKLIHDDLFSSHLGLRYRRSKIISHVYPDTGVVTVARTRDRMVGIISRYRETLSFGIDGSPPDRVSVNGTILGGHRPNMIRADQYMPQTVKPNKDGAQELNNFLTVASRIINYLTLATATNWPET